jgi:hypothetical protein
MKATVTIVCIVLLGSTAQAERVAKECPEPTSGRWYAQRCRKNVVERCFDDEGRGVRWLRMKTCSRPEVCVSDRPWHAECSAHSRLGRRMLRAATYVVGAFLIASGGMYRTLE